MCSPSTARLLHELSCPGQAQRSGAPIRDPECRPMGPGSAAHHYVLRGVRGTRVKRIPMRFAAIADVHGSSLALEAVLADIGAQGISDIVNPGDMLSGPLGARPTIDILMKLDAVQ